MTTHPLDTAPTPDVKGNPTQCEDDQDNLGRSMSRRSVQGVAASILRSVSRSSRPVVITGDEARILAGPAPDGGLAAWLCVVACALEQFCVFGFMTANGSLQAYYLKHQLAGEAKATVAWFGSIQTFIEFSVAMFVGRYFDSHGPRLLVGISIVCNAVALIGLAFSHQYYQFLLSFILYALSASLIYTPSIAVLSHWFEKKLGMAVGLVVCGAGIGGIIYPIIFERGFASLGYRNTMLMLVGMNTVLMLPGAVFMRSRLPPFRSPPWRDMKKPWSEVRFNFHVAGAVLYAMNILAPYFAAQDYSVANNVPPNITGYSVTFMMTGSIVGRIILGILADLCGVWTVFGTLGFASGIIMFALWLPPVGYGAAIAGLLVFGMVSGGWFALAPAATSAISPIHEAGMRFGLIISALAVPSLVGPVITSTLITAGNDSFKWAAVWCGCCFFVSGLLVDAPPAWQWIKARRQPKQAPVDEGDEAQVFEEQCPRLPADGVLPTEEKSGEPMKEGDGKTAS